MAHEIHGSIPAQGRVAGGSSAHSASCLLEAEVKNSRNTVMLSIWYKVADLCMEPEHGSVSHQSTEMEPRPTV